MIYVTTAFSPSMMKQYPDLQTLSAQVVEIDLAAAKGLASLLSLKDNSVIISAVGHEITAKILTARLGHTVAFNRVNIVLDRQDICLACIPQFRAEEAREYTDAEIDTCQFRYFRIQVE